jgi:hypothetical protein
VGKKDRGEVDERRRGKKEKKSYTSFFFFFFSLDPWPICAQTALNLGSQQQHDDDDDDMTSPAEEEEEATLQLTTCTLKQEDVRCCLHSSLHCCCPRSNGGRGLVFLADGNESCSRLAGRGEKKKIARRKEEALRRIRRWRLALAEGKEENLVVEEGGKKELPFPPSPNLRLLD